MASDPPLVSRSAPVEAASSGTPSKAPSALDFSLAELEAPAALPSLAPAKPEPSLAANPLIAKPAAPISGADERAQREQIRNAFSAKAKPSSGQSRKWLPVLLAVILVAIGGGGWYVWNEIQRVSRPAVAQAVRPPPAPAPVLPPAAATTGSASSAAPPATGQQVADTKTEPALPPLLPPELPKAAVVVPVAVQQERPLTEAEKLAKSIKAAAPKAAPPVALKPSVAPATRIPPGLAQAYAALQSGDYKRAVNEYQSVAAAEPLNLDAQLGLATAAAKSGDRAMAQRHYQQALDIDPKNPYALGGLLALRADANGDRQEAGLRTMISQNPDAPALHFALGNLLAAQRRWQEAQQAYFDAWKGEPERADFAYNLAVSLDQLKQSKLAREYYGKALALSKAGGAQFDPSAAARRLGELSEAPQ
jgi:Flp pilus assembly protein TadD